jgi:para-nitrobenzyl esterase
LYLNVWTAAVTSKERRPVMVWIHGGGLKGGLSWEKLSDGTKLAREGVVLVTIAYRLGAIGFLAHPELTRESGKSSGNYGLFDVVAALKWVQANIAQYGGDPSRVTIFGGSAGGLAVGLLAGAPAARGLYARAIAQSGSGFLPELKNDPEHRFAKLELSSAEKDGQSFFRSLGVSDLKSARRVSAEAILKASQAEQRDAVALAIIDGDLVHGFNADLFRQGRFNDTPILVGFTSDEEGDPPAQTSVDSMKTEIERWPCNDPQTQAAIAAAYPHATDAQTRTAIRYLHRDFGVAWPTWTWARLQTTQGHNPAYVYVFDVHDREHPFGAPHASEYPYVFGNFPKPPAARDEATSALIRKYWINFATHGNPNGPGLPVWKTFDERSQAAMVFDDSPDSRRLPNFAGLQALDAILRCANTSDSSR